MPYDFHQLIDVATGGGGRVLITVDDLDHGSRCLEESHAAVTELTTAGIDVRTVHYRSEAMVAVPPAWNRTAAAVLNLDDFTEDYPVPVSDHPVFDLTEVIRRTMEGRAGPRLVYLPYADRYERHRGVLPFMSVLQSSAASLLSRPLQGTGITVVVSTISRPPGWVRADTVVAAGPDGLTASPWRHRRGGWVRK